MSITRLSIRNFRCFKQATFEFVFAPGIQHPGVTIIQGGNGSGKTSLLEALHYGCYLRSFRTHLPIELCHDAPETTGFTIQITTTTDTIFIGVLGKKRVIKVNNVPVAKYHELISSYKVVTFIEDDLQSIKGYPEARRSLIDHALSVQDPHYHGLLRSLRKIIDQRTKIIQNHPFHTEQYELWTDQLIEISQEIIVRRKAYLSQLMAKVSEITQLYDTESFLTITYREKRTILDQKDRDSLRNDELRAQRTLYGPQLDDIEFLVYERNSRSFASRGQQKLAIMFLKIAQASLLLGDVAACDHNPLLFLVDDFLTDFDELRVRKLLKLLFELKVQLIITTPQPHELLYSLCKQHGAFKLITIDSPDPMLVIPHLVHSSLQEISG